MPWVSRIQKILTSLFNSFLTDIAKIQFLEGRLGTVSTLARDFFNISQFQGKLCTKQGIF